MFDTKIKIIVQSKKPEILKMFKNTFLPTTEKFPNLSLEEITGEEYGAKEINKILIPAVKGGYKYFGVFNDDLVFSDGWLEDCLRLLKSHPVVSAGYVNTRDSYLFEKAVEETKDETDTVQLWSEPTGLIDTALFQRIGIYDERFDWSVGDLDWSLRFNLNKISNVTSKKITVQHFQGESLTFPSKNWYSILKTNKQRFYDKHGYVAYREIRRLYKQHHQYFRQFL